MTKTELVNALAKKSGLNKSDASKALTATLEAISDALKAGDKVSLIGFGTFSVSERAARTGKNPQTGEAIDMPSLRSRSSRKIMTTRTRKSRLAIQPK